MMSQARSSCRIVLYASSFPEEDAPVVRRTVIDIFKSPVLTSHTLISSIVLWAFQRDY